jgi:hypothetical protein
LLLNINSNIFTFNINNLLPGNYTFYITAISRIYSSPNSNIVTITI